MIYLEWIKVRIETISEGIETVSDFLLSAGVQGLIIEDDKEMQEFFENETKYWDYVDEDLEKKNREFAYIEFYLSNNIYGKEIFDSIKSGIATLQDRIPEINLGSLDIETDIANDEDWVNNWKKYYKTFEIGEKLVIKPIWEEYDNPKNRIIFTIEPGHAFGTGLHHTTQLCILNLEKYVTAESEILDLGCGTGILSIIALLLGGKKACALDIDPNAANTAQENAKMNNISREKYETFSGNILEDVKLQENLKTKKYNLILANIVADVIIPMTPFVKEIMTDNGIYITSGIIDTRKDDVINKLIDTGFEVMEILEKEGWVSIVSRLM